MDALDFLKEKARMCRTIGTIENGCDKCPLFSDCGVNPEDDSNAEKVIEIVEKWSKEHPAKTRMSEFLKHYPDTRITNDGFLPINPCFIDREYYDKPSCTGPCDECRKKYWLEEIGNEV